MVYLQLYFRIWSQIHYLSVPLAYTAALSKSFVYRKSPSLNVNPKNYNPRYASKLTYKIASYNIPQKLKSSLGITERLVLWGILIQIVLFTNVATYLCRHAMVDSRRHLLSYLLQLPFLWKILCFFYWRTSVHCLLILHLHNKEIQVNFYEHKGRHG